MKDIFDSIAKELEKSVDTEAGCIDFSHLGYTSFPFSKDHFHPIPSSHSSESESKTFFIDGGNAEIFSSSSLSLSFIRICHMTYQDNKRIELKKDEFFCLVKATKKDNQLTFTAKLYPHDKTILTNSFFNSPFEFSPDDNHLTAKGSRANISMIPGIIRRFAELSTALLLTKQSKKGDTVIIDGSFESKLDDEQKLIETLKSLATENQISVAGLCKTSNLLTSTGTSPILLLAKESPQGSWFYFPVADAPFHLYFTKLHPRSDYIFRLDMLTSTNSSGLLHTLEQNSTDPVFLGYPYGLIEADRFARVSNHEKEYLTTSFFTSAGASSETLRLLQKSLDAHSILDNIS